MTAGDSGTLANLAGWNPRVVGDTVPCSEGQLGAWRDSAADVLDCWNVAEYMVHLDIKRTKVVVTAPAMLLSAGAQSELQASMPATVLEVRAVSVFDVKLAHKRRDQYPPYDAGLHLWNSSDDAPPTLPTCTSGYLVRVSGTIHGTTAGHCASDHGTRVFMGRTAYVGSLTANGFTCGSACRPVKADVARLAVPADYTRRSLVFTGGGGHRPVTDRFFDSGLTYDTELCFQGSTSGNDNCGYIRQVSAQLKSEGVRFYPAWCISFHRKDQVGDSGGPVYGVQANDAAKAAGMVAFTGTYDGVDSTCFSSIGKILSHFGASMVLDSAARRGSLVVAAVVVGIAAVLGGRLLVLDGAPAALRVDGGTAARSGATLTVRTVPRSDEPLSKSSAFRLDRREGEEWVAAYDLYPLDGRAAEDETSGPPEGDAPGGLAVAVAIDAPQRIRLPDLPAGRYRLRKWVQVGRPGQDRDTVVISTNIDVRD